MSSWNTLSVQVPGKDIAEPVRNVLETLLVYLDVLKSILDTVKVFLVDFGNPIKALVEALIKLLEEVILSLQVSGFFAYYDVPNPLADPNLANHYGGPQVFLRRFKASLYDSKDYNRPQPRPGSTGGFVVLMCNADFPYTLLSRIKQLLKFFGKEFSSPRYASPQNTKALPVGDKGSILSVANLFGDTVKAIEVSWTLPSTNQAADPTFQNLASQSAKEIIPPYFLIERNAEITPSSNKLDAGLSAEIIGTRYKNPGYGELNLDVFKDSSASGLVEYNCSTGLDVPSEPKVNAVFKQTLMDEYGEPFVKFHKYILLPWTSLLLGTLGRYRYIDTDVEPGKTYYYQVRAYSGELDVDDAGNLNVGKLRFAPEVKAPRFSWPAKSNSLLTMGQPSGILQATAHRPVTAKNGKPFDVVDSLTRLFQLAITLSFHLPHIKDSTAVLDIGKGLLESLSNPVANVIPDEALDIISILGVSNLGDIGGRTAGELAKLAQQTGVDLEGGERVELPWETSAVRRFASRLARQVAQTILTDNSAAAATYASLATGPFPDPTKPDGDYVNIQEILLVATEKDPSTGLATAAAQKATLDLLLDEGGRKQLVKAVQFVLPFALGGTTPDWVSAQPLRDIIPWASDFLMDILDKIRGLLDAYQSAVDEINQFILLLERKIDALERFIQFLIDMLNFLESLELEVSMLSVSGISGDISNWAQALDSATNVPATGPGSYSAGAAFAYTAPDVEKFQKAFSLIFGG